MTLSEVLRDKGVRPRDLAKSLGVGRSTASRWLAGTLEPSFVHVAKMVGVGVLTRADCLAIGMADAAGEPSA